MRSWEDKTNSSVPSLFWPAVSGLLVPSLRRRSRPLLGFVGGADPPGNGECSWKDKGADKSVFSRFSSFSSFALFSASVFGDRGRSVGTRFGSDSQADSCAFL